MARNASSSGEFLRLLRQSPLPAPEITAVIASRHWSTLGKGARRHLSRKAVVQAVLEIPAATRFARKLAAEAAEAQNGWNETSSRHYRSILALMEGVQDAGTALAAPLARIARDIERKNADRAAKHLARLNAALQKGTGRDILSTLLKLWSFQASAYLGPTIRKQFAAKLKERIKEYTRGELDTLSLEIRFTDSLLAKPGSAVLPGDEAAGTIKKALKSAHPELYGRINLAFKQAKLPTPMQRSVLSRLLDSRLYSAMKAMARKTAETASQIETATIEVRQARVALRAMMVKKLCTFGFGGAPDARSNYAKARERLESLTARHTAQAAETVVLKQLLVTYVQGASRTMKGLSRTMADLLKTEFAPGYCATGSMAAQTFASGLKSLKLGSPTDEKFWQIVLSQGLRDVALARCTEIADKLNANCKAAYKGFVPMMRLKASHGKSCVDLSVETPDAGPNIFAEPLGLMLENIEAHAGRFHSHEEKKKARTALAALKKASEAQEGSGEMKSKLLAADHLERLKSLHRKERYRVKPEPVRNMLHDYEAYLAGLDPDDSRRVEYVMELANLIPPMATGLMQLDEGFGVIRADGRDILLEMEKILLEKDGDIQDNMDEIKVVFDTARSELLAVEPAMLKQLTKNVPALKRAMNFMSKDQQDKKEKKKNSVRG